MVVVWRAGLLGIGAGWSAAMALAYGFATLAFPYSTLFYGHQLAASLLFIAFAVLLRTRERGTVARRRSPAWARSSAARSRSNTRPCWPLPSSLLYAASLRTAWPRIVLDRGRRSRFARRARCVSRGRVRLAADASLRVLDRHAAPSRTALRVRNPPR